VTLTVDVSYVLKDPGRYRDRDRRHRRTILSSSRRYPSPWSVSSFFLTSSSPAAFCHNLVSDVRMQAFGVSKTKQAFHSTQFTRPATYHNVCAFTSLIPIRATLHAPDAWQMKKNFSPRLRAFFGAFPQAHPYNVTTGSFKSSHQHQRHHHLRYPRSSKSSLGPKAHLVPRICLVRDSARNRQNPYRRECVYGSSARHCGGYHAVAQLSSRFGCT
jgi:hypothetical protein